MGRGAGGWSLATRLTAWYVGSAFALVLAATAFLYWVLITSLDREEDLVLADQIHIVRVLLRERPDDAQALEQEVELEPAARAYSQIFIRVLAWGDQPTVETPGMREMLPTEIFPAPVSVGEDLPRGVQLRTQAGKSFHIIAAQAGIGPTGQSTRTIQVALDRGYTEEFLTIYRRNLWVVLGLALFGCALGGHWIARRGVWPLQKITATARRIRSTTLDERIAAVGLPAELADMAGTFNEMLDRLEESFKQLSRFCADIAHELRTPVNNLRGEAEVALGRPRSPEEYREVLGSSLEECGRLSRLIDNLLFLARTENPQTQVEREAAPLGRELETVREFYEAAAAERGVTLTAGGPGDAVAEVNRPLFQQALGNLVANALAHTQPGGRITIAATREDGCVRVEVADSGCGISEAHLPHLCDRFYRVDASRTSSAGGIGLGLAIVKSIAELHGGTVDIASEVGRGTRVALVLPASNLKF